MQKEEQQSHISTGNNSRENKGKRVKFEIDVSPQGKNVHLEVAHSCMKRTRSQSW